MVGFGHPHLKTEIKVVELDLFARPPIKTRSYRSNQFQIKTLDLIKSFCILKNCF